MKPRIAVVAPGNMGAAIAERLVRNGIEVVTSLAGRSEASAQRAERAGMRAVADEELTHVDVFLSVVPPNEAVPLARRVAELVRAGRGAPAYADLNAISPATSRQVGEIILGAGAIFVDGGIIGMPPREGYSGPTIYVSGPDTGPVETLSEYGLQVRRVDQSIGSASALKMSYAGITKGLIAIGSAMILAAERNGVGPALRKELGASQPRLLESFSRSIPDMFSKAGRWVPEMEEIASYIGRDLPEGRAFGEISELYARLAASTNPEEELSILASFFANGAGRG